MKNTFENIINKQKQKVKEEINHIIDNYVFNNRIQTLEYDSLELFFKSFNFEEKNLHSNKKVRQLIKEYENLNVIFTFGPFDDGKNDLKITLIGEYDLDKDSKMNFTIEKFMNKHIEGNINSIFYYGKNGHFRIEYDDSFNVYKCSEKLNDIDEHTMRFILSHIDADTIKKVKEIVSLQYDKKFDSLLHDDFLKSLKYLYASEVEMIKNTKKRI